MSRLIEGRPQPIVAVLHLPVSITYEQCPGLSTAIDWLSQDLEAIASAGFDGVLLENDNDKPHVLTVSKSIVAYITRLAIEARRRFRGWVGVGIQRIDWDATLAIAAAAELDMVRLDTYVDEVEMMGAHVRVAPEEVLALRKSLRCEHVELWTDVHVKHAKLLSGGTISDSATRARGAGASAVVVTGEVTGQPPSMRDLEAARTAMAPVVIGSGLTPDNAVELCKHSDGALVGTTLKTGDRIDPRKSEQMVSAWKRACRSPR